MANEIYEQLEGKPTQFQGYMRNPFQFLMRRNVNIPQEYQRDPHKAVQYLLDSGQMDQKAFNQVFNTMQRMGFKFN